MQKQKPLSEFIKTKEEYDIIESIEKSSLVGNSKIEQVVEVVGSWQLHLGIPKKDVTEELIINSKFIYENFKFLTLKEIKLAYILSILGKLEEVEFYGNFSAIYISKVLNSYLYYRKMQLADAIRRKEKHEQEVLEANNKPTPQEEAELTKEIFRNFYNQWKEVGEINDLFNICYNFLRKHTFMKVEKEEIDMAMEWGGKKAENIRKEGGYEKYVAESEKKEIQRWARNWCVQNFFSKIDFIIFENNIKPELF